MLYFPAPSVEIQALSKVGFARAWRDEAALTVGDVVVKPDLRACVRYYDALKMGMPALPLVLTVDVDGSKNYSCSLADGRTDGLLTHIAAKAVGL
jgi:hypothetical protein